MVEYHEITMDQQKYYDTVEYRLAYLTEDLKIFQLMKLKESTFRRKLKKLLQRVL